MADIIEFEKRLCTKVLLKFDIHMPTFRLVMREMVDPLLEEIARLKAKTKKRAQ